ncbi:MAG: hypothetical protein JKY02_05680, partial [Flavobacteriaceae bacterium]|nr:hypothetical protein [Flavobacteriaceae bacterium]
MKKILKYIIASVVMLPMALSAQTTTENHVVSKTYKVESQTPLNTKNPDSIVTAIQYFDGLGRAKQSVLIKGGTNTYGNNEIPYDWSAGAPTNSGFYNLNGSSSENQIITGTTPFGDTDLVWESVNTSTNDTSTADGGWTTDSFNIDKTKAYRYTVWIKKNGSLTDGASYHGVESSPKIIENLNGTINPN